MAPGSPAPSSNLFLQFKGKRVCIVYRQDNWYGHLGVELDHESDLGFSQRGEPENLKQICLESDRYGCHSLTLGASEENGVITIDAIKVFETSAHRPAQPR